MENIEKAKYLKSIDIKELWGRYDLHWTFNADVNILVGENGTGKSTVLQFIDYLIDGKYQDVREKCTFMKILFDNDWSTGLSSLDFTPLRHSELMPHVFFIKTFDSPSENKKPYTKSRLDDDLDIIITNYLVYQNKLLRRKGDRNKILEKNDYFFKTINRLFETTHKTIFEDTENITDANLILKVMTPNQQKLTIFELSSGEKQMLLILLTVLCQDEQPAILLMDEPEISLHLRWQYELINIIRTLNPNCQVIIATHSPSIYGKGWRNKVFFMDKLLEELPQQTV